MKNLSPESLEQLLTAYGEAAPFEGKKRVQYVLETQPEKKEPSPRPRLQLALVMLVAMLAAFSGAALAFSQGWISLPRIEAQQNGELISDQDPSETQSVFMFENQSRLNAMPEFILEEGHEWEKVRFATVSDANHFLPFPVAEPSYLPEGLVFTKVDAFCYLDNAYYEEFIFYNYTRPEAGWDTVAISQEYVGPDAKLIFDTNARLSAHVYEGREYISVTKDQAEDPYYSIYWLDGPFAFCLGYRDFDEGLKVAASITAPEASPRKEAYEGPLTGILEPGMPDSGLQGEPIATLSLPRMEASRYTALIDANGSEHYQFSGYGYRSRLPRTDENYASGNPEYREITSLDEAQELFPFPIAWPAYLPEGYAFDSVSMGIFPNGNAAEHVNLSFRQKEHIGQGHGCALSQEYVGPEAVFSIDCAQEISEIRSGGRTYLCVAPADQGGAFELYWMDGNFGFSLFDDDLNEGLRIAGSVHAPDFP